MNHEISPSVRSMVYIIIVALACVGAYELGLRIQKRTLSEGFCNCPAGGIYGPETYPGRSNPSPEAACHFSGVV